MGGIVSNRTFSPTILIGQAAGGHPAAWMHPSTTAAGSTNIDYYRSLAQLAERGLFDLFFIADTPAARTDNQLLRALQRRPQVRLARPHFGRPGGVERRDLGQRLRRAQFSATPRYFDPVKQHAIHHQGKARDALR
jgi:hypothetical protein